MLRWLLVALLMANAIYFSWQWTVATQPLVSADADSRMIAAAEGEPLVLISEVSVSDLAESREPKALREKSEVERQPVGEPAACWIVGPFQELVSARQLKDRLTALSLAVVLYELQIPTESDFWVYLGPEPSRTAAVNLLRELQKKKVDSFLITEGELSNGISLGLFSQKARAEALLEVRRKQGYQANVQEVPRYRAEIWAKLPDNVRSHLSDQAWTELVEGLQGVEVQKNRCDSIASAAVIE